MKIQAPRPGSESQDEWLRLLEEMGGQFWPPKEEEEDMPEVGAKYPMMLYDGNRECIVFDVEERAEATRNGFRPHPSMERDQPPGIVDPPKPPGILDPPKPPQRPDQGGPEGPSQELPSRGMPPPIKRQESAPEPKPETKTTTTATVSVQKSVEVKKPATPAPPPKAPPTRR